MNPDVQIGHPASLWLIVPVLAGFLIAGYALDARRRAALKFSSRTGGQRRLVGRRHLWSGLLVGTALICLALAMLDIRWGKTRREVPQKGIEVMFLLDVSRSMLAEDATPNRLERAKQQILDMIAEMAGDRIGLVAFAGDTRQVVPMTTHYDDFRDSLKSVGPHTLKRGGSKLGQAIESAASGFISIDNDHKAMVILTDGEDQESDPVTIAKQLHEENGVRIFTIGLGDFEKGARIPDQQDKFNQFVQHEGQQVWSKLNGSILKEIATETDGAYIPAGTKQVNMADVYHQYVANVPQTEFESATIDAYTPRFQWFAIPALILLMLEIWVSTAKAKHHKDTRVNLPQNSREHHSSTDQPSGTHAA